MKGRKRHIVTNTQGHLLHVKVHAANIHDTKGAVDVLERAKEKFSTFQGFSGDEGYQGTTARYVEETLTLTPGNIQENQR